VYFRFDLEVELHTTVLELGGLRKLNSHINNFFIMTVYHEEIRGELKTMLIYECRCDEGLKGKGIYTTHIHWVCVGDWNT
jgi:hypothetical protein